MPASPAWLPTARSQGRREENEDEEDRDEEHRGGPRQDDGQAAEVGIHGLQTQGTLGVLREPWAILRLLPASCQNAWRWVRLNPVVSFSP